MTLKSALVLSIFILAFTTKLQEQNTLDQELTSSIKEISDNSSRSEVF
ncbi:hypothetical protein SAMN06265367_103146 [Algoriphagus winogradskyi]|uniref:Uncharacterized protein n=1 Tax=Algoriphagus winogradskyi TaxID=237017 RepID=A0ABY1NY16_9BACT|nr:hypothetical protein SAMN06265367_103146 [Algoriphagus winogradskyi]